MPRLRVLQLLGLLLCLLDAVFGVLLEDLPSCRRTLPRTGRERSRARASDAPADEVIDRLFVEGVLDTARRELPAPSWYVLCRRYGLHGETPATLVDLGRELGVSRETVRKIEQQALGQLHRAIERPLSPV